MGEFFNTDNKVFQGLSKVVDCVCLSILWFVMCIPIVTAGASTTALYYTVNKVIRNNRSYLWKEYWSSFCANFKQAAVIELLLIFLYALLGFDCYVMFQTAKAGKSYGMFYIVFVVLMVFLSMWAIYLFPYIARFANTTKEVLKNTALIAVLNLGKTILLFVLSAAVLLFIYLFPVALFVVPAAFMLLVNYILEKIFVKYMSAEDIEAEKERNMEYYN